MRGCREVGSLYVQEVGRDVPMLQLKPAQNTEHSRADSDKSPTVLLGGGAAGVVWNLDAANSGGGDS